MQPKPQERERLIRRLNAELERRAREEQTKLFGNISQLVNGLDVQDGQIKQTTKNLLTQSRVNTVFTSYERQQKRGLIPWFIRNITRLLGLSRDYFRSVSSRDKEQSVYSRAVRRLFLRLGLNDNEVIPGSWLDEITAARSVKARVMGAFQRAIMARIPIRDFSRDLSNDFLRVGVLVKDIARLTRDLFITVDREVQNVYREELGLGYALYSGTRKDNTRSFCVQRIGRAYTADVINGWNALSWKGKNESATVETSCGGHRCRHSLSWITKTTAEAIADRTGKPINSFN